MSTAGVQPTADERHRDLARLFARVALRVGAVELPDPQPQPKREETDAA
ncbi:MAG: hypothetical protein AB7F65_02840 [Dehalococcoidia bacterium]